MTNQEASLTDQVLAQDHAAQQAQPSIAQQPPMQIQADSMTLEGGTVTATATLPEQSLNLPKAPQLGDLPPAPEKAHRPEFRVPEGYSSAQLDYTKGDKQGFDKTMLSMTSMMLAASSHIQLISELRINLQKLYVKHGQEALAFAPTVFEERHQQVVRIFIDSLFHTIPSTPAELEASSSYVSVMRSLPSTLATLSYLKKLQPQLEATLDQVMFAPRESKMEKDVLKYLSHLENTLQDYDGI